MINFTVLVKFATFPDSFSNFHCPHLLSPRLPLKSHSRRGRFMQTKLLFQSCDHLTPLY
jgi:hypothetical protein